MPLRKDWPCWEIMKCEPKQAETCPAYHSTRPCWEIMSELDVCSFTVCSDCIVYVTKQEDSIFSREEILSIMCQKGIDVIGSGLCPVGKTKQNVDK